MDNPASVQRALDQLEKVQEKLADVATRNDDRRKADLINFRRELSHQIAEVGRILEPVITGTGDPELLSIYRKKLSAMRSAAAMHQANWPAVSLDESPAEYAASARGVRDANQEFVKWVRGVLVNLN